MCSAELLGVPSGFLLGRHLVESVRARLSSTGSGATLTAHFSPALIMIGAVAGILCGVLVIARPPVRLVREGPLASMVSAGGVQHARRIPTWPLLVGVAMMAGAFAVGKISRAAGLCLSTWASTE